jgi:hypothetical protein
MNSNVKTLLDANISFMANEKGDADEEIRLLLLCMFVKKICIKKDNKYIFTNEQETYKNHELIDKWLTYILRCTSSGNKTQIKGSSRKVRFVLNHLCKELTKYNIKCEKYTNEKDDNGKTVKETGYEITGL